ncbi:lipopolysaccharide biosynthesis protein, partial [Vibrio crassostreae]
VSLIAIIEMATALAFTIGLFGGEQAFINYLNKNKYSDEKSIFIILMMIFLSSLFVSAFIDYLSTSSDVLKGINNSFIYIFLISSFCAFNLLLSSLFRSRLQFFKAVFIEKSYVIVFSIFIITSFYFGSDLTISTIFKYGVLASFFSLFISAVIFFCSGLSIAIPKSIELALFRSEYFNRNSAYIYMTSLLIIFYERIDQFFLLGAYGLASLSGYYAVYKISFASRFLTRTINTVSYPFLSKYSHLGDSKRKDEVYSLSRSTNFYITFITSIIIASFPEEVIGLFYGDSFSEYSSVLVVMSITMAFGSINQSDYNYMNSSNMSKHFLANSVIAVTIQISLILLLTESFGLIALVFSRMIAAISSSLYAHFTLREHKVSWIPLFFCFLFLIIICLTTNQNFIIDL